MKRILAILLTALLITALLASCAASRKEMGMTGTLNSSTSYDMADSEEAAYPQAAEDEAAYAISDSAALAESSFTASLTEKIIYSHHARIETTDFDKSIDDVGMLIKDFGAFIETSYISGSSYHSKTTYRSAEYIIRVPVKNFATMKGSLSLLGNIVSENTNADNITAQFTDVEARLETYRTEERRLLVLLEKAETVEDMITIEERLSEVRYQIESLTSTLRNWQNQIDYSSVTLYIQEVEKLSELVPAQRTYWERMSDGLSSTVSGIGDFFKSLFMFIVVALPVIIVLGVIAAAVVIIARISIKRKRRKNNGDIEHKQ